MKGLQIKRQFKQGGAKGGPYFFTKKTAQWLFFALLIFLPFVCVESAKAADISWIGTNVSGNWEDPSNWSSGTVPTSADNVTITTTSSPVTVFINDGTNAEFNDLIIENASLGLIGNIGSGHNITIRGGQLIQSNFVPQVITGKLTMGTDGNLTHAAADTVSPLYKVDFTAEDIEIEYEGSVSAVGQGFAGGEGANINGRGPGGGAGSTTDGAGGGGHGGVGGNGEMGTPGGLAYCDKNNPSTYGSGGGNGVNGLRGGWGGGYIHLKALNTFTFNGYLTAEGESVTEVGDAGGAGGSVFLEAQTFIGTPRKFSARGGDSGDKAGGGAGGCILLTYTQTSSIVSSTIYGGAGVQKGQDGIFIAASPAIAPIFPVFFTDITDVSARFNWTIGGAGSFYYVLEQSVNGTDFNAVTSTINATSTNFIFENLNANTRYWFRIAATNGIFPTSTYTTSSPVYTLAHTPKMLENVSSKTTSTIEFTVSTSTQNGNDQSIKYVVKDEFASSTYYLQANGTWSSTSSSLSVNELGAGSPTTTTDLLPNTLHTLSIASVNSEGTLSPFSSSTEIYTRASTPKNISASVNADQKSVSLSWQGDATSYLVTNKTNNSNSGWINATSYTSSNLTCNTKYTFEIKGRNGNDIETSGVEFSASTGSCSSGGGTGGSGGGTIISIDSRPPNIKEIRMVNVVSTGVTFSIDAERAAYIQISPNSTFDKKLSWQPFKQLFVYNFTEPRIPSVLYLKFLPLNSEVESKVFTVNIPSYSFPPAYLIETASTPKTNKKSQIAFTKTPSGPIRFEGKLSYAYKFTPTEKTAKRYKIIQSIELPNGKVVSENAFLKNLSSKKGYSGNVSQFLKTALRPGKYVVKIKIVDTKKNKTIDTNQFGFTIKKR